MSSDRVMLLSAGQVAKKLGVTRQRVYQLVMIGKLTPVATGIDGLSGFHPAEVDNLAEERASRTVQSGGSEVRGVGAGHDSPGR